MAVFNSLVHCVVNALLEHDDYIKELNMIKHIAVANGYNSSIITQLVSKHKCRVNSTQNHKTNMKYILIDIFEFEKYLKKYIILK